jgi:hypothetical protein
MDRACSSLFKSCGKLSYVIVLHFYLIYLIIRKDMSKALTNQLQALWYVVGYIFKKTIRYSFFILCIQYIRILNSLKKTQVQIHHQPSPPPLSLLQHHTFFLIHQPLHQLLKLPLTFHKNLTFLL